MSGSAMTSVNKVKVPALFSDARRYGLLRSGMRILDYGCGRWPEVAMNFLGDGGIECVSWDPNWFPLRPGSDVLDESRYDAVCLSNVLNVIEDPDERDWAVRKAWSCVRPGGRLIVTVYPGDRSGASGPSKPGCWQERRPLSDYCEHELKGIPGRIYYGRLWASDPKPEAEGGKDVIPHGR